MDVKLESTEERINQWGQATLVKYHYKVECEVERLQSKWELFDHPKIEGLRKAFEDTWITTKVKRGLYQPLHNPLWWLRSIIGMRVEPRAYREVWYLEVTMSPRVNWKWVMDEGMIARYVRRAV